MVMEFGEGGHVRPSVVVAAAHAHRRRGPLTLGREALARQSVRIGQEARLPHEVHPPAELAEALRLALPAELVGDPCSATTLSRAQDVLAASRRTESSSIAPPAPAATAPQS